MPGNRAAAVPRPTRAAAAQQGTSNDEEGTNAPSDATPTQLDESTATGEATNEGNEQANAQSRDEVAAQAIYASVPGITSQTMTMFGWAQVEAMALLIKLVAFICVILAAFALARLSGNDKNLGKFLSKKSAQYIMDWANLAIGEAEEELATLTTHSPRRHALRSWDHLKQEPVFQERVQRTREEEPPKPQQPNDEPDKPDDEEEEPNDEDDEPNVEEDEPTDGPEELGLEQKLDEAEGSDDEATSSASEAGQENEGLETDEEVTPAAPGSKPSTSAKQVRFSRAKDPQPTASSSKNAQPAASKKKDPQPTASSSKNAQPAATKKKDPQPTASSSKNAQPAASKKKVSTKETSASTHTTPATESSDANVLRPTRNRRPPPRHGDYVDLAEDKGGKGKGRAAEPESDNDDGDEDFEQEQEEETQRRASKRSRRT